MSAVDPMRHAIELGRSVRALTPPNPWVGCVIEALDGRRFEGATEAAGGRHAEAVALDEAGEAARGATAFVSLEPCSHHGRTPPCADALVAAGVAKVVVGVLDPDPRVSGAGVERLRDAGVEVLVAQGDVAEECQRSLRPYLHQRRTGRPWVVLKLAASADGCTAASDGSSQWITGEAARADAHRLRSESDAIIVGAGTVRADDPALTVRSVEAPRGDPPRIVLGAAPANARVHPCREHSGSVADLLDELGSQGAIQVLVEGGATVAHDLHFAGLVDQYVLYVAPALFGGSDALGLFAGAGAPTISAVWRGEFESVVRLGSDLRLDLLATAGR